MVGSVNLFHLHLCVNIAVIQEVDISYLHLKRHTKADSFMYFYQEYGGDRQYETVCHVCSKTCCIHRFTAKLKEDHLFGSQRV